MIMNTTKWLVIISLVVIFLTGCSPTSETQTQSIGQRALSGELDISNSPELQKVAGEDLLRLSEMEVAENESELEKVPGDCNKILLEKSDGNVDGYWFVPEPGFTALYDPTAPASKTNTRYIALMGIYRVSAHPEFGVTTTDGNGDSWVRILNKDGKAGWVPMYNGTWCAPLDN